MLPDNFSPPSPPYELSLRPLQPEGRAQELEPEIEQIDWHSLPNGLARLKELLGPEAALKLSRTHGGTMLYVPRQIKEQHPLFALLGPEAAKMLAAACGGDRLEIPKPDAVFRQFRKKRIITARKQGQSIAALAERHNLSRRRILQILAD